MVRGILNPTGTACHLSSALVLLAYAMGPLRTAVVSAAMKSRRSDSGGESSVLQALGAFFEEYMAEGTEIVDPSGLYSVLRRRAGLEAHLLGDAVTALAKLLQAITSDQPLLQSTIIAKLLEGRVHSVIQERVGDVQRSKETRVRPMSYPFPLSCESAESLPRGLEMALSPKGLENYRWSGRYDECVVNDEDPPVDEGATKALIVDACPVLWMFHLQRFGVEANGTPVPLERSVEIPLDFEYDQKNEYQYRLVGGILHVTDEEPIEADEEESGHYVALIQDLPRRSWYLVDDDQATLIEESAALDLMAGASNTVTRRGSYMMGVLAVYDRLESQVAVESALSAFQEQLDSKEHLQEIPEIDCSRPEQLVGRRLQVRWSGNKCYAGTVASYNAETKQHRVRYDDGDVRDYVLEQKTIEWL